MFKVKYIFVALLVSMVALTGCGKKNSLSPEEVMKKARENAMSAENYKMKMDFSVGVKSSGMSMEIGIGVDGVIDVKNEMTKMNMTAKIFGMEVESEMYTDSKSEDGKVITYTLNDDEWTKTVEDATEENEEASKKLFDILSEDNKIKELDSDKENYNYEITIDSDTLKELMSVVADDVIETDVESIKGDMVLKISIDKDTYNYSKISMDMKEILQSAMAEDTDSEDVEISKAEFIIEFSDFNKAGKVEIPSDVIENAVEEDDFDFDYDYDDDTTIDFDGGFEFDEADYDTVLSCSMEETEEGVEMTTEILVGFNNDTSVAGYYDLGYVFENTEDAEEFYNSYEREPHEMVLQGGSSVFISGSEEFTDEDEKMSYADAKSFYESIGMVCE